VFRSSQAHRAPGRWHRPLLLAVACLLVVGSGCDSRVREIRSGLSDRDLLRFDRGQKVSSPCWACHDFYGTQNKVGPYLSGVFGRRAGGSSFPAYSEALRSSGIVWDRSSLARFLASPQTAVPGTTMVSPGVSGQADLDALLFYMELVTR
jgi:cytochrome c